VRSTFLNVQTFGRSRSVSARSLADMSNEQPLPVRRISLVTDSAELLTALQPERPRSIVQIQPGEAAFALREVAWGDAALQRERWGCGTRIRVERPSTYVCFALMTRVEGAARWMGTPFGRGSIMRIVDGWDAATTGPVETIAFAVGREALAEAELRLRDPDWTPPGDRNRVGVAPDFEALAPALVRLLERVDAADAHPAAQHSAEQDLIALAARLDRPQGLKPVRRLSAPSSRLALIRRVESWLAAHEDAAPPIPALCEIAGTSERTLEYAFREHLGMTPVRFLKIRRLNVVRRRLLQPVSEAASVTEVALACGFYDLGRFAGEYRALFGERPSETLARATRARGDRAFVPARPAGAALREPERPRQVAPRSATSTPPQSASRMLPRAQPTP